MGQSPVQVIISIVWSGVVRLLFFLFDIWVANRKKSGLALRWGNISIESLNHRLLKLMSHDYYYRLMLSSYQGSVKECMEVFYNLLRSFSVWKLLLASKS